MSTPHDTNDDLENYAPSTRSEAATMFDDEDYEAAYRKTEAAEDALADDDQHEPTTAASANEDDYERIGEYSIHFAASEFPLLGGKDFEDLVASIRESGQTSPIMQTKDGIILDGRNRLRAIYRLRDEGHSIEARIETWEPADGQTEVEYILAANLHRRHLTDTERAMIAAELVPAIEIEAENRQKSTRIKEGEVRNREGRNQHSPKRMVPPGTPRPSSRQKRAAKEDNSALAKVAKVAKVSKHKLRAATAVIRSGNKQLKEEVKAGTKSLSRAQKEIKPKTKAKTTEPEYDLAREVKKGWDRLKKDFTVAEFPEVRKIVMQLIRNEEQNLPKA